MAVNRFLVKAASLASSEEPPFFIGVSGASASGKSTVCESIVRGLGDRRCMVIALDWFYHSLPPDEAPELYNFDHPRALDFPLLLKILRGLKRRTAVTIPRYDFVSHRRLEPGEAGVPQSGAVDPGVEVVILEGILVFWESAVREMLDMKIFVDTDPDVCLARRIKRDVAHRGRDLDFVLTQYARFIKPAFEEFILPTKRYADLIIPRGGENLVAIDLLIKHVAVQIQHSELRNLPPNLVLIPSSYQLCALHTILRDASTSRHDFIFYSDRLMRLIIEAALGALPFTPKVVATPAGVPYVGASFAPAKLAAISLIRGGEAMERALRAVCKGVRVGKMHLAAGRVVFESLPSVLRDRYIFVLEPVIALPGGVEPAVERLLQQDVGCREENILLVAVVASRAAAAAFCRRFPKATMVVSAVDRDADERGVLPGIGNYAERYFGA